MFGLRKQKTDYIQPGKPNQVNLAGSIHTMEDDLNMTGSVITRHESPQTPSESRPYQTHSDMSPTQAKSTTSPFLANQSLRKEYVSTPPSQPDHFLETSSAIEPIVAEKIPKKANFAQEKFFYSKNFLITLTIIATLLAASAGGYYFWTSRQDNQDNEKNNKINIDNPPTETPQQTPVIETPPQKYSLERPNYLVLETASPDQQHLKNIIVKAGNEIRELNPLEPVEFILVDSTNNPVPFSSFASLANINLDSTSDIFEDSFSIYIYPDTQGTRIALVLAVKDKQKATLSMTEKEKTLVQDLLFIFLDEAPSIDKTPPFNTFISPSYSVHYVNLDPLGDGSLSLDYAFLDNKLVISTSKNTMLKLMDKLTSSAGL